MPNSTRKGPQGDAPQDKGEGKRGPQGGDSDMKSREYRDAGGEVQNHSKKSMEQHGNGSGGNKKK